MARLSRSESRRVETAGFGIIGLAVAVVGVAMLSADPAEVVSDHIAMYPRPGTDTANPETAISIRGAARDRVGVITATGSQSGPHTGAVRSHPDGAGVTFVPDQPFVAGERVAVRADVALGVDDRATFQIGVPGQVTTPSPPYGGPPPTPPEVTSFASEPWIVAPVVVVEGDRVDGLVLSTPQGTPATRRGAMITTAEGELVWWYSPEDQRAVANLLVTTLYGEPVLVWFEGEAPHTPGWFLGDWVVVDAAYRQIARISAANGLQADVHDLELTPRGTAVLLAYQPLVRDATAQGGDERTIVLDGVVQEVDVATGDVLFEWHSLDHVPLAWSAVPVPDNNLYDYAHINAIDATPSGDVLVTMRHADMVAEIDRRTGALEWVLGGPAATVDVVGADMSSFPHHARWIGGERLSVFDNGVAAEPPVSRGLTYQLDPVRGRASVVAEYVDHPPAYTETQGSLQHVGQAGVALVGWGELGRATVHATGGGPPIGRVELHAPSYRVTVADWRGEPAHPPSVRVEDGTVHLSWNGATEVASWELRPLDASGDDLPALVRRSSGFETSVPVPQTAVAAAVRARSTTGDLLVETAPFPLRDGGPVGARGSHRGATLW
jgi:hypothetical protein